jgi:hypothetical protein
MGARTNNPLTVRVESKIIAVYNIYMSYEITLRKLLESADKELHGRLLHLETLAKPLLVYTQGKFPYYTILHTIFNII